MTLTCEPKQIHIGHIYFGRANREVCRSGRMYICENNKRAESIRNECDLHTFCYVSVFRSFADICNNASPYLQITYECKEQQGTTENPG